MNWGKKLTWHMSPIWQKLNLSPVGCCGDWSGPPTYSLTIIIVVSVIVFIIVLQLPSWYGKYGKIFCVCFWPHLFWMLSRRSGYLKCQWYFGSCSQTTHYDANNPTLRPILWDLLFWGAPKIFDSFKVQDLSKNFRPGVLVSIYLTSLLTSSFLFSYF